MTSLRFTLVLLLMILSVSTRALAGARDMSLSQRALAVRDVRIVAAAPSDFATAPDGRVFLTLPITIVGHGPKSGAFSAHAYWTGVMVPTGGRYLILRLTVSVALP